VNLTQKYLHFLCLCYQSRCALLLTGWICDRDVIAVCILPRLYIFLQLETMSFSKLVAIWTAVIFAIFTKVCRDFYHFFLWFSTVPIHVPSEMVNYVWLNTTIHTHNMLYNGSQPLRHRQELYWGAWQLRCQDQDTKGIEGEGYGDRVCPPSREEGLGEFMIRALATSFGVFWAW